MTHSLDPDPKPALPSHTQKSLRQLTFISLGILILSLLAALSGWLYTWHNVKQYTRIEFQHEVNETRTLIKKRLEIYIGALYGLKGFFAGSKSVERNGWMAYVQAVDVKGRYPGATTIGFVERVRGKDKAAFIESVRRDTSLSPEGFPNFSIYPAGERPEYFVVKYVEPYEGNEQFLGFDPHSDPARRLTLQQARDTGLPAATGRVSLFGDVSNEPAFIIFLPVYKNGQPTATLEERRASLEGLVAAAFRTEDLFAGIFSTRSISPKIDFEIFDGERMSRENLLYDESPGELEVSGKEKMGLFRITTLDFAGRTWSLFFHAQPGFGMTPGRAALPLFVLIGGLLFSFLFSGTFYSLATSRHRAVEFAMRMTEDLRREVGERKRAEDAVRGNLERVKDQQFALLTLTRRAAIKGEEVMAALKRMTETSAKALGIERVSIWRFTKDNSTIHCVDLYELNQNRHSSGAELAAANYPRYFQALKQLEVIAARDAHHDPRTSEFTQNYLIPLGIQSMMDVPVQLYGMVTGVLCHEHVGRSARQWMPDEQTFAVAMGNLISLVLEQQERRRAEEALRESETLYTDLFREAPDPIVTLDLAGCNQAVNRAVEQVSGFRAEELIGKHFAETGILTPGSIDRSLKEFALVIAGQKRPPFEIEIIRKDGVQLTLEVNPRLLRRQEKASGVQVILRDLTERRQTEAALFQKTEELARTNAEREQLELFTYMASHDMQEPLQKIIAFGDVLKEHHTAKLDSGGKDYVDRMVKAALRMSQLLDDLLKFSRVRKTEPFETVNLNLVAREALADLEVRIAETRARVEIKELPALHAVKAQMNQLFQNLIANAIKFHKKDETPRVVITSRSFTEGDKEWAEISVEDNGVGFEEKYMDKIFKPFERLHSQGEFEGSGVGLAVCQKIVLLHGGKIKAKSVLGKGSVFIVTLPLA